MLIGTKLHPALGYILTVKKSGNWEVVLLRNHLHKSDMLLNKAAKESSKPQESDTVIVKLLTANKIPVGHRKLVRAKIESWLMDNLALFTSTAMNSELNIADVVVEADAEGCLKLIVEYRGYSHMELEEGMKLGTLEKTEQVDALEESISKAS